MKKKILLILFLILGLCLLGSCDKDSSEDNKENKEKSEINFENSDSEVLKQAIDYYKNDPEKFNYYSIGIDDFTMIFGYDYLYEQYLIAFMNTDREFETDEEKIALFNEDIRTFEEKFGNIYDSFKNEIIPGVEAILSKGIDEKGKELDEKYKKFIDLSEEKIKLIEEIKKYYNSGEYKEDNFSKGKKLDKRYLDNYIETRESYKEVYNLFLQEDLTLYKNDITENEKEGLAGKVEFLKARILLKMFTKELYASDFDFEIDRLGTIIKVENKSFAENLEKIQKSLEITISNMEKIDNSTLEKEKLDIEKYTILKSKLKEISQMTNNIIEKFKISDYEELISDIINYTEASYLLEIDFRNF